MFVEQEQRRPYPAAFVEGKRGKGEKKKGKEKDKSFSSLYKSCRLHTRVVCMWASVFYFCLISIPPIPLQGGHTPLVSLPQRVDWPRGGVERQCGPPCTPKCPLAASSLSLWNNHTRSDTVRRQDWCKKGDETDSFFFFCTSLCFSLFPSVWYFLLQSLEHSTLP